MWDWWIGLVLGYPDQAIEEACTILREDGDWKSLVHADLPAAERYRGALPLFSYAPTHSNDPGIRDTIAVWSALLEGVYPSDWHQQLMADPAFQAARHEREAR